MIESSECSFRDVDLGARFYHKDDTGQNAPCVPNHPSELFLEPPIGLDVCAPFTWKFYQCRSIPYPAPARASTSSSPRP
eukprot:4230324-Pyramimonas_sp.AAC.1